MALSPEDKKIKLMVQKVNYRKVELAELKGEKTQIMKTLQEEGCDTTEELDAEITKESKRVEKLDVIIASDFESIEQDYDWS